MRDWDDGKNLYEMYVEERTPPIKIPNWEDLGIETKSTWCRLARKLKSAQ